MTERSETERAELVALADLIDNANGVEVCTFDPMRLEHKRTHLSGDDIARLGGGLAAFKSNSDSDKQAYYAALSKAYQNGDLVLSTFQPDGERREAIARIICYWDEPSTCHDNYCCGSCRATILDARFLKAADQILASGLVQDEAGIRRDEREKCLSRVCEALLVMSDGWKANPSEGDSAWVALSNAAALLCGKERVAAIRSARDGGAS